MTISEDKECFGRLARKGLGAYFDVDLSCQWGHGGARVSDAAQYPRACAREKLLKRIWGTDEAFMQQHGEAYAAKLREQYLIQARCLLNDGEITRAREALRNTGPCPLRFRILAAMPAPLVRGILGLRRALGFAN